MIRALPTEHDRALRRNSRLAIDAVNDHLPEPFRVRSAYRRDPEASRERDLFDVLGLWVVGAVAVGLPLLVAAQIVLHGAPR